MKKLITSSAVGTIEQPVFPRTLQHLQEAYTEAIAAVVKNLTNYVDGTLQILFGCVITNAGAGVFNITEGAVFYNGEVYLVIAGTITCAGAEIPVWVIDTSYQAGDPVTLYDSMVPVSTANVHEIKLFKIVNAASGSGLFDYGSANVIYNWQRPLVKVVEMGDWDMTTAGATPFIYVAHGLPDIDKIRNICAIIRTDWDLIGSAYHRLNPLTGRIGPTDSGSVEVAEINIVLTRVGGGVFDGSHWDSIDDGSGHYNRGWVTIEYMP